jgi:KTSC domain
MNTGLLAPVVMDSTTLARAAYDTSRNVLELEFRNGARYLYFAVPEAIYVCLLAASSKGAFFNRHIRNRFAFLRISD